MRLRRHRYRLDAQGTRYESYESYESYATTVSGGQLVVLVQSLDLVVGFTGGNYNASGIWGGWQSELIPARAIAIVREGKSPPNDIGDR